MAKYGLRQSYHNNIVTTKGQQGTDIQAFLW